MALEDRLEGGVGQGTDQRGAGHDGDGGPVEELLENLVHRQPCLLGMRKSKDSKVLNTTREHLERGRRQPQERAEEREAEGSRAPPRAPKGRHRPGKSGVTPRWGSA